MRWVVRHVVALCERHAADDLAAVVAAAFFHDAVYDPAQSDNEARSAELAERALAEIGWPAERRSKVVAMVAATAGHDIAGLDRDARTLVAADLAVLATEPSQYADYVRAVRREYAHVDDVAWRAGRSAVLAALLARDHLFPPELELSAWERRARANITAELASLTDRSSQDGW